MLVSQACARCSFVAVFQKWAIPQIANLSKRNPTLARSHFWMGKKQSVQVGVPSLPGRGGWKKKLPFVGEISAEISSSSFCSGEPIVSPFFSCDSPMFLAWKCLISWKSPFSGQPSQQLHLKCTGRRYMKTRSCVANLRSSFQQSAKGWYQVARKNEKMWIYNYIDYIDWSWSSCMSICMRWVSR